VTNVIKNIGKDSEVSSRINEAYGNEPSSSAAGKHMPGDIVEHKGKKYRVGQDGDSLEEIK